MIYNPIKKVVVHDGEVVDFDCGEDLDCIASILLGVRFKHITEQQAYIRLLKLYSPPPKKECQLSSKPKEPPNTE